MAWHFARWKRLLGRKRTPEPRPIVEGLPPVEQLESRLCLGSARTALFAEWTGALPSTSVASEVLHSPTNELSRQSDHLKQFPAQPTTDERWSPEQRPTTWSTKDSADAALIGPSSGIVTKKVSDVGGDLAFKLWKSDLAVWESSSGGNTSRDALSDSAVSKSSQLPTERTSPLASEDISLPSTNSISSEDWTSTNSAAEKASATKTWSAETLRTLGLRLRNDGSAEGLLENAVTSSSALGAWWTDANEPVVIGYDFRDLGQFENVISGAQRDRAVEALQNWSEATGGKIVFVHDQESPLNRIINIGNGNLAAFGHVSGVGGVLGLGGGRVAFDQSGTLVATGVAWLDQAESWDTTTGNGNPPGTVDFKTVVAHEVGHTLGLQDTYRRDEGDIMNALYDGERLPSAIDYAVENGRFYRTVEASSAALDPYEMRPMVMGAQLAASEVEQLLRRGAAASSSDDAIIAVVDRNGRILGVRVEQGALAQIPDEETLVFAIDGAVAKARTAALFSNGDPDNGTFAPLTSRTVRFISQSTVTEREVNSNPNLDRASSAAALASTERGPGFVAPIGLGGHFPPDVANTPLVDLFGIEHTNRDSNLHPGPDGVKGTPDDIDLRTTMDMDGRERGRFNIDPAFVPAGQELFAPESYGHAENSNRLPEAQSRGIATLPGGIPLFRDTNGDGMGETLVGGIGVFFPGPDGFASFEQGFVPGIGQTTFERTNAPRVLEAEFIALAAAGGSLRAEQAGIIGAKVGDLNGVAPLANLDLPFGRLDLVGVTLEVIGPIAGPLGVEQVLQVGTQLGPGDPDSGADQPLLLSDDMNNHRHGLEVPEGWLVMPHASDPAGPTAAEVQQMIERGIAAARETRAAVRLPFGERTRMVFAVTDTNGEVLGLYRMPDATTFSIDVAVAKARNVAYYADASVLDPQDQVVAAGTAFTNRTFRFIAQPRFPSGIDFTDPPPFSILNDGAISRTSGENLGAPAPVADFDSVLGHDAFFPMTNFRDPGDAAVVADAGPDQSVANQNGIVFFPGSTPLYRGGVLIGGLGVSGDGVDQDDVVTFLGSLGFRADGNATRADQTFVDDVRLPYQKFLRNPFG